MSNYNHSEYLSESLNAIVNQSVRPYEVIVCDDASTDNSVEIIQQFVNKYPFVRLIRNERNLGVFLSFNKIIALASGDYLYTASADDKVLPGLFEKSMEMLKCYPQAGLCCSDVVNFNGQEGFGHIKSSNICNNAVYLTAEDMIKILRKKCVTISSATCISKRSAFMETGSYIPELKWNSDWFTMFTIIFRHGCCYIPEPLASQRILNGSYAFSGGNNWKLQKEIMFEIINLLDLPKYNDVQDSFKKGYNLAIFGMPMLYVLLKKKNWKYVSFFMFLRALWCELRKFLGLRSPFLLKAAFYQFSKRTYNLKGL